MACFVRMQYLLCPELHIDRIADLPGHHQAAGYLITLDDLS